MKYLKFLLPLILIACGPKGDKIPHTPTPNPTTLEGAFLIDFEPLEGSHIPMVQYFEYNMLNTIVSVIFLNQITNTSTALAFKATPLGQNMIGAMFENGQEGSDLYLWFVLQLNPTETVEYTLELFHNTERITGYETVKMGNDPQTKIRVTYESITR